MSVVPQTKINNSGNKYTNLQTHILFAFIKTQEVFELDYTSQTQLQPDFNWSF